MSDALSRETPLRSAPLKGPGLAGRVVVNTRAPHQAGKLSALLAQYGASALLYPCIDIVPPDDTAELDRAILAAAAGDFDWLVLTSANTVRILSGRLAALPASLDRLRVAAVGPETADLAQELLRIDVDLVAEEHVAESLAAALKPAACARIFLPQSAIARPVLAETLRASGAEVVAVSAYQTMMGQGGDDVPDALAGGQVDALLFTSSSTVRYFLRRLEDEGGRRADLEGLCLAAIGPVTAETLTEEGLPVAVMPADYTLPALVVALDQYFRD